MVTRTREQGRRGSPNDGGQEEEEDARRVTASSPFLRFEIYAARCRRRARGPAPARVFAGRRPRPATSTPRSPKEVPDGGREEVAGGGVGGGPHSHGRRGQWRARLSEEVPAAVR